MIYFLLYTFLCVSFLCSERMFERNLRTTVIALQHQLRDAAKVIVQRYKTEASGAKVKQVKNNIDKIRKHVYDTIEVGVFS